MLETLTFIHTSKRILVSCKVPLHEIQAVNEDCFFLWMKNNKKVTYRHPFSNTPEKLKLTCLCCSAE